MSTIEIITNGTNSFELNRVIDRNEMWKLAQEEGYEGTRVSFMRLLDGKVKSSHGYEIKVQKKVPSSNILTSVDKINILKEFPFQLHIVNAKTEIYGTLPVHCGRMQITPLTNGLYSIMILPKKGFSHAEVIKNVGFGQAKSQYVRVGKLTSAEVISLVKHLG